MNFDRIGNTAHTLNLKRFAKPTALLLCALFIAGIAFAAIPTNAAPSTSPLHVSGNQILDANNNPVTMRGVGIAGMAPDLIFWNQGQTDNWGNQWQSASSTAVTDTFKEMSQNWGINMIRVFVYPEWYWLNSAPGSNGNTQSYIQTLVTQAAQYGIYVDLVPYQLTACSNSFSSDPYMTPNQGGGQGLPMNGFDSAGQSFLSSTGLSEQSFWSQYWTLMANNLKAYPNVIFEAWNEPAATGNWGEPIPSGYQTYLKTMYDAIRGTGATNLIFMQWEMGWAPGDNLGWASTINNALGGNPSNVAYTTHFYYYAPSDLTSNWGSLTASNIEGQLRNAISQMGVNAPLVANEEGSCLAVSSNKQNDITWWSLLVQAQAKLGIGYGAYYWLSDSGLGGAYLGETLLSSGYAPNAMGQAYINTYSPTANPVVVPPAPIATPTPTPTAKPTPIAPTPTVVPTATPTPSPTPTASATAPAQSNIANDDFENGVGSWQVITAGSGYSGTITPTADEHNGNNAGLFTIAKYGTGGYIALSQQVPAQIGQTYTVTFWYKSTTGFAMPHVFAKDASGKDLTYFSGPAMTATNTWTQATMTFGPVPTGTARTELHIDVDSAGTVQLDDLSINVNPSINGNFENGVNSWNVITAGSGYSGTIAPTTDAHSGKTAGLFTIANYGTGGYIALSQQVPAQIGQTYTVTFWYKSTTGFAMPHVFAKDASGNDITYFSGPVMAPTNTWTQATMTLGPIPSETACTELHFDVASTGTIQIDGLSINTK